MPTNYNGYIRDSLDLYKSKKTTGGSSASEIERVFGGFQKVPRVVCERYDIGPYLLKMQPDLPPDLSEPTFVALHEICNHKKKCSVRLNRENLERLKEEFRSERSHGNKTSFTCDICQKVYLSEKKLLNHRENKHVICYEPGNKVRKKVSFSDEIIVHEVKEYHRCRKCPKFFEDYDSLKAHTREVHKKRRCYICFYCSKDFVDRMFFKVHVKLHCDACGLLLPNKKRYAEHRRNTCKIIKKYVCKTCEISLFYFMDLKDHSYEHLGNFYICDICKDRFDDKCALSHHIEFLHSKRRPKILYTTQTVGNNRVYVCKFCEVSSVDRALIEKHVSTFPEYEKCAMTGYKDFYFCDQCFLKFSTETDMLQHKWSHFLKTMQQNVEQSPKPVNLLNRDMLNNVTTQSINSENMDVVNTTQNVEMMAQKPFKRFYNIKTEKLPPLLQPRIVLEKLIFAQDKIMEEKATNVTPVDCTNVIDLTNTDEHVPEKPKKRRTLFSKHQCELCLKFLSTKTSLNRHMYTIHGVSRDPNQPFIVGKKGDFHCNACEEDFALPSLLKNHNCIRINLPEPPFQDARPEIHLDTTAFSQHNGFDDIDCNYDYMNSIDFDIPAPIVELTEYENVNLVINDNATVNNDRQFNGTLNNVTVNNDRQFNNATVNNRQLNNVTVNNDCQFTGQLNNASVNIGRQFTNVTVNNDRMLHNVINIRRQFNRLLNNAKVSGQLNNVPVNNDRRFPGQLINMPVNSGRQINNPTVNNDRQLHNVVNCHRPFNGPLNNVINNDRQVNGQLNNVQLNSHSRKQDNDNVRYIVVQEVPIEF